MPVVINEFEVVDTPPAEASRSENGAPAPAPQRPDPQDLRRWLAEQAEHELRLHAH